MKIKEGCVKKIFGIKSLNVQDFDHFDCQEMKELKSKIICVGQCVASEANLLLKNGRFDVYALRDFVKSKVGQVEWQRIAVDKILDKCIAEANDGEKGGECSLVPLKVTYCIWEQFIKSCPVDSHSRSYECQKIRSILSDGDERSKKK